MNTKLSLTQTARKHWPEYLMEAWGLGMFMISACFFTVLIQHPDFPVSQILHPMLRLALTGIAMALTAIAIIHSPWGKRSGAHLNPAFTWTYFRLGKVQFWDAVFYSIAQFTGGISGVLLSSLIIGSYLEHPAVHYAATLPGVHGVTVAFIAETGISFLLMLTVLTVSNHSKFSRVTPFFAGSLIALYITFEAPLSGMSMNPARTLGSASFTPDWTAIWIYFVAPLMGMLLASQAYLQWQGTSSIFCAKYHHHNTQRCIFRCNFGKLLDTRQQLILSTKSSTQSLSNATQTFQE